MLERYLELAHCHNIQLGKDLCNLCWRDTSNSNTLCTWLRSCMYCNWFYMPHKFCLLLRCHCHNIQLGTVGLCNLRWRDTWNSHTACTWLRSCMHCNWFHMPDLALFTNINLSCDMNCRPLTEPRMIGISISSDFAKIILCFNTYMDPPNQVVNTDKISN